MYQELLELGERIGDVSTGLSEETILKCMKEKKYMSVTHTETSEHMEPCSVCQVKCYIYRPLKSSLTLYL